MSDQPKALRLAREAHGAMLASGRGMYLWHGDAYAGDVQDFCERFAALVAQIEREECAQIAKQWDIDHPSSNYGGCIANAIRSRT